MKTGKSSLTEALSLLAIAGNILFIVWILYNAINESFQGTIIEKISYVTLMVLLAINAFLLIRNLRRHSRND